MDEYLDEMTGDMVAAIEKLKQDLASIRTGRATPKLVEGVQVLVASYGATMPLNQLATIQAADARLLTITPWDKTTIADIERGIIQAGLGLNPSSDGQLIRLPVPPLTKERRQDLVKQVKRDGEEAKVRIRHVRRDYNEMFKVAEAEGDISEDGYHRLLTKVQESTDKYVAKVDALVKGKEDEVLEI
ncbi:MAG: ribosome recycling factor [Myxococcota bacterium]|jgi:ribosome recycling factor